MQVVPYHTIPYHSLVILTTTTTTTTTTIIMLSTLRSSRLLGRQSAARLRAFTTAAGRTASNSSTRLALALFVGGTVAVTATYPTPRSLLAAPPPVLGGDVINTGTPVKEKATGILFPQLCNGYYLAGCGVRIKYGFVKVYALGTYLDPLAMSAVKKADAATIQQALCNPTYPRTIRIVMNRGLSMQKFTDAIVEALVPRMKGQDMDK